MSPSAASASGLPTGFWPAGDLGVVKAVSTYYFGGRKLMIPEVRQFGERLDPFQNLSAHYLLTGLRVAPPT